MKLPAHDFLEARGIPYETARFPPETGKGAANVARVLGFRESQMVKTLLFETGAGERVLVLLPGDRSALSSHLKQALGSRDVRMARPEVVLQTTGYAVGSVPPFHWQPPGFRCLLDAALLREPRLGVGAGAWGHEILLAPSDLQRASGAVVVNLTERGRPVMP
jgi:Cys-tRNA(Pro)/Cys-tRNA(Cys) deacylase